MMMQGANGAVKFPLTDDELIEWAIARKEPAYRVLAKLFDDQPSFYREVLQRRYIDEMILEVRDND